MPDLLRADFHIHTEYSMDSDMSLEEIIERCQKMNINCIAVSDHGNIEGALKMQEIAPFKVIVAEEILTPYGEIMGMFLKEGIDSHISIEEAISRIKAQDALVCLPHPFDRFRGLKLNGSEMDELAEQIDILEIFNARSPLPLGESKAQKLADKHNLPVTAGSDSHSPREIGYTYMDMPDFDGKDDFPEALRKGVITRQRSNIFVHFSSTRAKLKRLFGR
ncbi:PHP-associated domain-containing protein [Chloroflexota bacterium]